MHLLLVNFSKEHEKRLSQSRHRVVGFSLAVTKTGEDMRVADIGGLENPYMVIPRVSYCRVNKGCS